MEKGLFNDLLESVQQADGIVKGKRAPSREFHIDPLQVKEIRQATGLSQARFAELIHVSKFNVAELGAGPPLAGRACKCIARRTPE